MELRYYQREAKNSVQKELKEGVRKQLLVLATGTGKTALATDILKDFGKALWITHTEELIEQSAIALLSAEIGIPKEELEAKLNAEGGLIEYLSNNNGGMFETIPGVIGNVGVIKEKLMDFSTRLTVASIQTLWRRLDKIPADTFDVIVVDEAHYSGAATWVRTLDHFAPNLRLGLTATPYRMDGMLMGDIFDKITYEYPIDKAVKDGYLCKIDAIRVKTNVDIDKVRTTGGELNQGDLTETINTPERNGLIVRKYLEHCRDRQFIAFCSNVQHAIDLCECFKDEGIVADYIVGDKDLTTDRKGVINDFKSGKTTGLTNVMVLTAGFDHTEVSCVIEAAPTKSLSKYLQQVGRGTRLKKGDFKDLIILDFVDTTTRHRLINAWELDKAKDVEDKVFISDEKRQKLMEAITKREAKVTQQVITIDERVNLLAIPVVKISNSIRMNEPATQPQLDWLERLGYNTKENNYTKKMCSEIIGSQSASPKQIWAIKKMGYDVSAGVTIAEAKKIFQIKEEKKAKESNQKLANETGLNFNL